MKPDPHRGEVWYVNLNPVQGHEQGGERPALVLSVDQFNHGPADLVVILPITSRYKGIRSHVAIGTGGGMKQDSFVICEQPRTISKNRLRRFAGTLDSRAMLDIEYAVRVILGL